MAADRILIRNLRVRGIVGVDERERQASQEILVNLELERDLAPAAATDDIADALDYSTLAQEVVAYVESSSHFLIERLAEEIAGICLAHGADVVRVRVEKPAALGDAEAVGVEIERPSANLSPPRDGAREEGER